MDRIAALRSLLSVGDARNLPRAAHRLGVSTSLLSRHLAQLERSLGTRLVDRGAGGFELTANGRRLHAFAQRILTEIDAEEAALRAAVTERQAGPGCAGTPRPEATTRADGAAACSSPSTRHRPP